MHVSVYSASGLAAEYTAPLEQNGIVWEIAEITGATVTPIQRIYSETGDMAWCMEDKEIWDEKENALLLETLLSKDNALRELMEALVHKLSDGYFSYSSYYSEDAINMLLRGEREGIEKFFGLNGSEMPPVVSLLFTRENSPENLSELGLPDYGAYLTGEQANFLLSSVCGKPIDFDFSIYERWQTPYIGFGGDAGDTTWTELEHFSVDRINANTWKARAYNVYKSDDNFSMILNRVCFTVTRNPGSCFEDYSLTGFEVEEEADTDWMKLYYDYLTTDQEGIVFMDNMKEIYLSRQNYWYNLIYVDDDMIPEIYLEGAGDWYDDILLFLSNGKVTYKVIGLTDGGIEYIPYTGILNGYIGMGSGLDVTYSLANGSCVELANEGYGSFILDGTEVTEEQYRQTIDSYIGNGQLQKCVPYSLQYDPASWLKWNMKQW